MTVSGQISNKKNSRAHLSSKGFTLVELIVVIVIALISSAIAVPSFIKMMQHNRLKTTADSIKQQLYVARSRALANSTVHCGVYFDFSSTPQKVFTFTDDPTGAQDQYNALTDKTLLAVLTIPINVQMTLPSSGGITNSCIVFRGDGSAKYGGTVNVTNSSNTKYINVLASTGRIKVY